MNALRTVVVIRHARSKANADPTEYSRTPDHAIPLVFPHDDQDAIRVARFLRSLDLPPASVVSWSSPHLRCRQTEDLVLRHAFGEPAPTGGGPPPGVGPVLERRESFLLRERDYGEWSGLSDAEVAARHPELHARWTEPGDAVARFLFRYPGGESRADVAARVALFQERLRRDPAPHHLLFVHGIVHRLLRMVWFDRTLAWSDGEPNPANASVACFRLVDTSGSGLSGTDGVAVAAVERNDALLTQQRWTEDCPDLAKLGPPDQPALPGKGFT
jgi:broad specificity phosphatase PhoE